MELLDARQLSAFRELARKGSFTAAANSLNLTQSAISHSIKALEKTLEVELFERLGKTVRLTRPGEALLPHADRILARMAKAQDEIRLIDRPGHGRLRIGATVTISQYVLPTVLRELRESFPAFEISVVTDDSRGLLQMVESGDIDVAVAIEIPSAEKQFRQHLFVDEIEMALSPMHPLATMEKVKADQIVDESFIFYNQCSETYRLLEQRALQNGIRLKPALQVGSMAAIKEMAKIGMGIGMLAPWVAEEEIANGSLVFRRLPWKKLNRSWAIYSDPRHKKQMIEEVFAGICINVVETLQQRTQRVLETANAKRQAA